MTICLGWVPSDVLQQPVSGITHRKIGQLTQLLSEAPTLCLRERLKLQQVCFRAYPTFLPKADDVQSSEAEVLADMKRLSGLGALRLNVEQPLSTSSPEVVTGRAYLRGRRNRRFAADAWARDAHAMLEAIAGVFSVRGRRRKERNGMLTLDLLMPASEEARIQSLLDTALSSIPDAADINGRLTISGLWVPTMFLSPAGVARV